MAKRTSKPAETAPKTEPSPIASIAGAILKATDGTISVTPLGLAAVEAAVVAGAGRATVAALLGISRMTLRELCDRQPEVGEALARGKAAEEQLLVGYLRRLAAKGYGAAAMFLLKTRHGYRETTPVPPPDRPPAVLLLPAPMSAEEFRSIIDGTASPVADAPLLKELPRVTTTR
jgi:hypothetical protein